MLSPFHHFPRVAFVRRLALALAVPAMILFGAPGGALLAKDHLAASMDVPARAFSLGQLIRLKGAVENDAPVRADLILADARAEAGLGHLPPVRVN